MKRGKLALAIVGLVLDVTLAASDACAQTAKDFVGTWTLVSAVTAQGGIDTFGSNAKGSLIVDANGRYMIAFARADLPKVVSNNRFTATTEENKAIVGGHSPTSAPCPSTLPTRPSLSRSRALRFRIGAGLNRSGRSPSAVTNCGTRPRPRRAVGVQR